MLFWLRAWRAVWLAVCARGFDNGVANLGFGAWLKENFKILFWLRVWCEILMAWRAWG